MKSVRVERSNIVIVQNRTKGVQNVSNLLRGIVSSKKGTKTVQTVIIPTGYYSIEQTATILGLSVYRTRQLQWEQKISVQSVIKRNRRVYYKKDEIERLKIQREQNKSERSDLDLIRFGKRVIRSIETITICLNSDTSLSKQMRQRILDQIDTYLKEAVLIVQESE